ncbi:Outer membrane protein beta-barrel domain-containing protein [Paenimyroides ummariense]|uniref:Outer membrane protein beta-barrel domain-containing protein n=1 Tax=Paenimyroides ummariense TaxID=913024 RepID=A0A1I4WL49_9FLAO|nr:outer membrane beta-barrel protein [Paenimyroides ummariense]SFN14003.1 Outer membrane protein beta-barrel domain-containing protein [Paenimyroides ummariense]
MRKVVFLGLMVFGFTAAQAQTEFRTGLRAGLNISTIEDVDASAKPGFYVGAFGNIKFTKFYSLQPELNFSMQGANDVYLSSKYFPETNGGRADIPLNYLGLTVMNKFNLKSFFLQVGPSLELLLTESKYNNNRGDLSLNVGLGYDITDNLSVEGRYKAGVADVVNDQDWFLFFSGLNYNSVFQVGLTYKFNK